MPFAQEVAEVAPVCALCLLELFQSVIKRKGTIKSMNTSAFLVLGIITVK